MNPALILARIVLLENKVDQLITLVQEMKTQMSTQLDALTEQVTRVDTLTGSVVTLLNGLSVQIASLKDDPAALQALSDRLKNDADTLATAVTANTPANP